MAWTKWKTPRNIELWTDTGIEFTDGDAVLDRPTDISTVGLLYAVSQNYNSTVNTYGSRGLIFSDFGFDAGTVAAVEVEIVAQRMARIVDSRVQLYAGTALGKNVADRNIENVKTYLGDLGAFWGIESVDASAANFGVLVDFAPRSDMPSSNTLIVRSVKMRVDLIA